MPINVRLDLVIIKKLRNIRDVAAKIISWFAEMKIFIAFDAGELVCADHVSRVPQ